MVAEMSVPLVITNAKLAALIAGSGLVPGAQYSILNGIYQAIDPVTLITIVPAQGQVSDMLATTALLTQPGNQFVISTASPRGRWIVDKDSTSPTPLPVWKPMNSRACLGARQGSIGHPVNGPITGAAAYTFANKITLPIGVVYPGTRLNHRGRVRKIGNGGTATVTVNIGTAGNATDSVMWTGSFGATGSPRELKWNTNADVYDATTITTEAQTADNVDQGAIATDQSTNFSCAAVMLVSVNIVGANAADGFVLENQFLWHEAF